MKIMRPSFWLPFLIFVTLFSSSVLLQRENISRWRKLPYKFRDTLYLPSSQYVKLISVGYDSFTADFLWLRMIQSFAGAWSMPENAAQIKSYFDVITDLDPKFNDTYSFAIMAIGEEGRHTASFAKDAAAATQKIDVMVQGIINKAIVKNYGQYKPLYEGAFYAFWSMNDAKLAKYYVRMAKMDPNYPDFIDRWEGYFDLQQGRYQAAYEKFMTDYIHAVAAKNKDLIPILRTQLNRAVNDWFTDEIKQRAIAWQKEHGQYPSVEELAQAGKFNGITLPDWTTIDLLLKRMASGEMSANADDQTLNRFIQGMIKTWDHLPPAPFDFFSDQYKGFVIWKTMDPKDKKFVLARLEAMAEMRAYAGDLTMAAQGYKKAKGKAPETLSDCASQSALKVKDIFDDPWVLDRERCEVTSKTYPNLLHMEIPNTY